jgi:allophanate hydrolase
MNSTQFDLSDIATLQTRYLNGELTIARMIAQLSAMIDRCGRPEIWISRVSPQALADRAAVLEQAHRTHGDALLAHLPLFGVPFAVKDNIDVAGLPTTAACPAFAYVPKDSAHVVDRLLQAGAILFGKTNLDQFATGLVGTRSPYGAVRNALHPDYVSGGSSSGSAVAVALGLVSFALGTDTAGSGRVPAGFNDIVGLKPTKGLISTRGVLPACRTIDCVSIFTKTLANAWQVLHSAAGYDRDDPFSRRVAMEGVRQRGYRIAIPDTLEFYGDAAAEQAFAAAVAAWEKLPNTSIVRIPFQPFADAARLLYAGPWVAERRAAIGDFFDREPEALDPTVRRIVEQADAYSAADAFRGQYRLAGLRRQAEDSLRDIDFLLVPTAPTMPTIAAVAAEPVLRNSELGYYTNFVNFFDMAALSIPAGFRADGLPAGITLIGKAGSDHLLAAAGMAFTGAPRDAADRLAADPLDFDEPTIELAVVGAHLDGQPLNWQLRERGARKLRTPRTRPAYRLYALANTSPPKPGLVRTENGGSAIAVEVWELPLRHFGSFVAEIPAPLGIGTVHLEDDTIVKGFICEPAALAGAQDITGFGGWRDYLASR